jgi:hypothetical protein
VRTKEGKVFAIAGVGTMPKLGTADFYRKHRLTPLEIDDPPGPNGLKDWVPVVGILSTLVPGMVDAALVTLRLVVRFRCGAAGGADSVGSTAEGIIAIERVTIRMEG